MLNKRKASRSTAQLREKRIARTIISTRESSIACEIISSAKDQCIVQEGEEHSLDASDAPRRRTSNAVVSSVT